MNTIVPPVSHKEFSPTYQSASLIDVGLATPLKIVEKEVMEAKPSEVRLRILASGVAFADILCRLDLYPGKPKLPFTPGYDLVGIVDQVGANVTTLKPGQMVAALLPKFGANTEMITMPAEWAVPVPEGVDPTTAVAVILNYLTAYRLLYDKAKAQKGERLLVHSAAGGVGTAVLQLGQNLGLEMYGTASKKKLSLVAQFGAIPINYQAEDFVTRIHKLAADGIDIVCDPVGGQTMVDSYQLLRKGGRLINYGFFSARDEGKLTVPKGFVRLFWYNLKPDGKKAMFFGSTPTLVNRDTKAYRNSLITLFDMLVDGRIQPIIGATFPLNQINDAHKLLAAGQTQGKIVLVHK